MVKKFLWMVVLAVGITGVIFGASHVGGTVSAQSKPTTGGAASQEAPPLEMERHGAFMKVTNVSGNTVTGTTWDNGTATVTVSSSTRYDRAGQTASLSDIHTGSLIAVRGTVTGTSSINATAIEIVLPHVGGLVTGVSGSSITVSDFGGASHTVRVDSNTKYDRAGKSASLSDITKGSRIAAEGNTNGDGSLQALRVEIMLPKIAGQVTAINGSSYTVSRFAGPFQTGTPATVTVVTSSSTTFATRGDTSANASAVKVGSFIIAEGTLSADGKTLQADRVLIAPASPALTPGAGPGGFGRMFRGHMFGPGGFGGWGAMHRGDTLSPGSLSSADSPSA